MIGGSFFRRACVLAAAVIVTPVLGQAPSPGEEALLSLPARIETRVPAFLEDRLADVERVAAGLPQMDRKKAYLITLPLQNYLEDVVLSGSREVTLHPRAMAWVIGHEAGRGATKKEIARLLVSCYQRDVFSSVDVNLPLSGVSDVVGGKQR